MDNVELAAHQSDRPVLPHLPARPHVPGAQSSRRGRTAVSCPDNAWSYTHNNSLRELFDTTGIRHITIKPHRPQTNGKVERFHQTMAREWGCGVTYRSHHHRDRALPHWLRYYNERRRHSGIGNRPPISRVHNLRGQDT